MLRNFGHFELDLMEAVADLCAQIDFQVKTLIWLIWCRRGLLLGSIRSTRKKLLWPAARLFLRRHQLLPRRLRGPALGLVSVLTSLLLWSRRVARGTRMRNLVVKNASLPVSARLLWVGSAAPPLSPPTRLVLPLLLLAPAAVL
jgi:hypothetical protein